MAMFKASWYIVAGTIAIGIAAALAYLSLREPKYRSEALITVQPQGVDSLSKEGLPPSNELVRSEIDVIQSSTMIENVSKRLGLVSDPEFSAARRTSVPGGAADPTLDEVAKRLEVENDGRSFSIKVSFSSKDASKAARVANAFADTAVAAQQAQKIASIEAVRDGLMGRLAGMRKSADDAERGADRYRVRNNLIVLEPSAGLEQAGQGTTIAARQASELARTQADLSGRRFEAAARLREASRSADPGAASAALASPIVQQLRVQAADLSRELAAMRLHRGPDNPDVVQLDAQLTSVQSALRSEIARVAQSLNQEARSTAASEKAAARTISELNNQVGRELTAQARYRTLLGEAEQRRSLYREFAAQVTRATERTAAQLPDLTVVSRAVPSRLPAGPSAKSVIPFGIVIGLVVGLFLSLVRALTRQNFQTEDEMQRITGLPVLSAGPESDDPGAFSAGRRLIAEAQRRGGSRRPAALGVLLCKSRPDRPSLALPWAQALVGQGMQLAILADGVALASPSEKLVVLDYAPIRASAAQAIDMSSLAEGLATKTAGSDILLMEVQTTDEGMPELAASLEGALIVLAARKGASKRAIRGCLDDLEARGVAVDALVVI